VKREAAKQKINQEKKKKSGLRVFGELWFFSPLFSSSAFTEKSLDKNCHCSNSS